MPTQRSAKGRGNASPPPKDRPVEVVRIRNVRANIWANRLEGGRVVYNVTFDRLWKEDDQTDAQGEVTRKGEWRQSTSFGKDDLLLLAKVADLVHTRIYDKIRDERREDGS